MQIATETRLVSLAQATFVVDGTDLQCHYDRALKFALSKMRRVQITGSNYPYVFFEINRSDGTSDLELRLIGARAPFEYHFDDSSASARLGKMHELLSMLLRATERQDVYDPDILRNRSWLDETVFLLKRELQFLFPVSKMTVNRTFNVINSYARKKTNTKTRSEIGMVRSARPTRRLGVTLLESCSRGEMMLSAYCHLSYGCILRMVEGSRRCSIPLT